MKRHRSKKALQKKSKSTAVKRYRNQKVPQSKRIAVQRYCSKNALQSNSTAGKRCRSKKNAVKRYRRERVAQSERTAVGRYSSQKVPQSKYRALFFPCLFLFPPTTWCIHFTAVERPPPGDSKQICTTRSRAIVQFLRQPLRRSRPLIP